jgi:glycosyltransferase involved in cell wall biosynthesis
MKILLVGEYSRLHNSLKEGLENLGHQVTLIATGDYFKDYPADIKLIRKYDSGLGKKIKVLLYKLFNSDITSISLMKQFFSYEDQLRGYDVVQLINECPLGADPSEERRIITYLKENNDKLYLLSCGADHISVSYNYEKKNRYSILDPLFKGKVTEQTFSGVLKYLNPKYKDHHEFVYRLIDGVMASDLDYHIPMNGHPKYKGLLPNPVNIEKMEYQPLSIDDKIIIFHGINRSNYYKKGSDYFEEALEQIQNKYRDMITIDVVENLPYSEFIQRYDQAHIILDQVLGYDQGYNALEAMAKGKVVFTGAEKEFYEHYQLKDPVAINVLPDADQIYNELEQLILDPELIVEIGNNARRFIEEEHNYTTIANSYVKVYTST